MAIPVWAAVVVALSTGLVAWQACNVRSSASGPAPVVFEENALTDSRSREYLSPFYTNCIRHPQLTQQGVVGTCANIHQPSNCDYKNPTQAWRKASEVIIDVGPCARFLPPRVDANGGEQAVALPPVPVSLRPWSTDHHVFLQVYCGADFNYLMSLNAFLPKDRPATILDAGANIGAASILFAHFLGAQGTVLAVEAFPPNFGILENNTATLRDVVRVVPKAIVPHDTAAAGVTVNFTGIGNQFWGFRVDHEDANRTDDAQKDTYVTVESISLPMLQDMAPSGTLDLIKLDIEGEERRLLLDPASTAVLCKAICIFMELHERLEPGCNAAFQQFLDKGCDGGDRFELVIQTGEYRMICRVPPSVPPEADMRKLPH